MPLCLVVPGLQLWQIQDPVLAEPEVRQLVGEREHLRGFEVGSVHEDERRKAVAQHEAAKLAGVEPAPVVVAYDAVHDYEHARGFDRPAQSDQRSATDHFAALWTSVFGGLISAFRIPEEPKSSVTSPQMTPSAHEAARSFPCSSVFHPWLTLHKFGPSTVSQALGERPVHGRCHTLPMAIAAFSARLRFRTTASGKSRIGCSLFSQNPLSAKPGGFPCKENFR